MPRRKPCGTEAYGPATSATSDEDDFLVVVGREKALLIAEDGEKYSPEEIEEAIITSTELIDQVMVWCDHQKYSCALVTLDTAKIERLIKEKGYKTAEELCDALQKEFYAFRNDPRAKKVQSAWIPAAFQILPSAFGEKDGTVNSTMKIVALQGFAGVQGPHRLFLHERRLGNDEREEYRYPEATVQAPVIDVSDRRNVNGYSKENKIMKKTVLGMLDDAGLNLAPMPPTPSGKPMRVSWLPAFQRSARQRKHSRHGFFSPGLPPSDKVVIIGEGQPRMA